MKTAVGAAFACFITFVSTAHSQVAAPEKPLALVYFGPGSCEATRTTSGCSESAKLMAEKAGYRAEFVGPTNFDEKLFAVAKVWVQPGGRARIQEKTMSSKLKQRIVSFVKKGGGYVGFCAGGFMATERFGWMTDDGPYEAKGLGLLKGRSGYYDSFDTEITEAAPAKIIETLWAGQKRDIYWELGPYFTSETTATAEVLAVYPPHPKDDETKALALRNVFGKGKVAVSATHPEAPGDWVNYYRLQDRDGEDFDLAVQMIRWAAAK